MGINTAMVKSLTFGVSALYTGVAGALGAIAFSSWHRTFQHLPLDRVPVGSAIGGLFDSGAITGAVHPVVPNIADEISKAAPGHLRHLHDQIYVMPPGVNGHSRSCTAAPLRRRSSRSGRGTRPTINTPGRSTMKRSLVPVAALIAAAPQPCAGPEETRFGRVGQKSRSATSIRTAVRLPRTERSGRRSAPTSEGQRRGRHQWPQDQLRHQDDGYSPARRSKWRANCRTGRVLVLFQPLGTPPNGDPQVHECEKVPQLFVATGATK